MPLLDCRKTVWKWYIVFTKIANYIQSSRWFENITIAVILCNSIVMMMEDPTEEHPSEFFVVIDNVFLVLYTVEMVIKITGMGLFWAEESYLRDNWN